MRKAGILVLAAVALLAVMACNDSEAYNIEGEWYDQGKPATLGAAAVPSAKAFTLKADKSVTVEAGKEIDGAGTGTVITWAIDSADYRSVSGKFITSNKTESFLVDASQNPATLKVGSQTFQRQP
jgi:hypothetical protein